MLAFGVPVTISALIVLVPVISYFRRKRNKFNKQLVYYMSPNFLVINKPPDISINSNDRNIETVQTLLKNKYPNLASSRLHHEFYFVHRLDFATSGLMCIPLHKKACQEASKAFSERVTKKYYVALIRGILSEEFLIVNTRIGSLNNDGSHKMCVPVGKSGNLGRDSQTVILVLEYGLFENYPCTKILIKPVTGRRHQIRVHCSYLGHTIVGDYTYSNKKDSETRQMFLHCLRLVVPCDCEFLDQTSCDPFTTHSVKEWKTVKCLNAIDEKVFDKLDKIQLKYESVIK